MDVYVPSAMSSPRRKHRKRFSLSHLSSDTTSTLPEYSSISAPWRPNPLISADRCREDDNIPSDRPPDYPQSADEADADTDDSTASDLPPLPVSPSRQRRFRASTPTSSSSRRRPSHTRARSSTSSTDPYLDSLLARSVHALEMSNTLLQSSISTHSSFSSFLASEPSTSTLQHVPEAPAGDLMSDVHQNRTYNDPWADDIRSIRRRMDSLLGPAEVPVAEGDKDAVSRSLPTSSPMQNAMQAHAHRHRSSTDLRHKRRSSTLSASADLAVTEEDPDSPALRLSHRPPPRDRLVAPAPRAVTLYVGADADPSLISLPSTLGQRSSTSFTQPADESTSASGASSPRPSSTSTATLPVPVRKDHPEPASESSTPAFTLLSSFLSRRPSTSTTAPSTSKEPPRSRSAHPRRSPGPRRTPNRHASDPRPDPRPPPEIRIDDILARSSSESSSSDPHAPPVRSMQALRRILDEQPAPDPPPRRKFLPRTPPPAPTLGTSSATASVSRLFTKSAHVAPRSALKGGSGSGSGSGASTPRRIQFAALPEGHAGSGRGFEKGKRRKGKEREKRGAVSEGDGSDGERGERAWWKAWLGVGGTGSERAEERVEARIARWGFGGGGRGFGGVEDWAV